MAAGVYYVTFVFSVVVVGLTICVIVYSDVANVQPCFNFSNEIIK